MANVVPYLRPFVFGVAFASLLCGDDITIPLDGGKFVIHDARFIRQDQDGKILPELSLRIENQSGVAWWTIELQFRIKGRCNDEPRQWSILAKTSLGWSDDHVVGNVYREAEESLDA